MCLCLCNIPAAGAAAAWHLLWPCPCSLHSMSECGLRATWWPHGSLRQQKGEWGAGGFQPPLLIFTLGAACWGITHPSSELIFTFRWGVLWSAWNRTDAMGALLVSQQLLRSGLMWATVREEGTKIKVTPRPLLRGGPHPEPRLCAPAWGWWGGWSTSLGSLQGCHEELRPNTCQLHPPGLMSSHHYSTNTLWKPTAHTAAAAALGLHECELACGEAAGCCYLPSHTRWQPVLLAGLFTLAPFATTKAVP